MTLTFKGDRPDRAALGHPPRPLPVLFHLLDVSRPRHPTVAPQPAARHETTASQPAELPLAPEPIATALTTPCPPPLADQPLDSAITSSAEVVASPAGPCDAAMAPLDATVAKLLALPPDEPATLPSAAAAEDENTASDRSAAEPAWSEVAPPAELQLAKVESPVMPRSPSERRKAKTPLTEAWFAAHGKYIAVCFLLALILTVYFARSSRQPATRPVAVTQPHAHPGDAGNAVAASATATATAVSDAPALASTAAARPNISESGPTPATEPALGNAGPKTELHPPSIPQFSAQSPAAEKRSADDKQGADDSLFPWAKKSDGRLASRPAGPATIINHTVAAARSASPDGPGSTPPPQAGVPAASPWQPATAPTAMPSNPSAAYPPLASGASSYPPTPGPTPYPANSFPPVATPAPTNAALAAGQPLYPTTNYRSQFVPPPVTVPPQPPPGWSSTAPASSMPPPYQPQDNSARGFRYERIGPGLP